MKTICIESPLGVGTPEFERNLRYLAWCVRDCFDRGEAPFASHGLGPCAYAEDPTSRAVGLAVAAKFRETCDVTAYYVDRGWSSGMRAHINERVIPCLSKALGEEERQLPEEYWKEFLRGEWPPGATVRWVPTAICKAHEERERAAESDGYYAQELGE